MDKKENEALVSAPPDLPDQLDPIDRIVAVAEDYAYEQAINAVRLVMNSASPTRFAVVWLDTYPRYYRAAYYDKYFPLLREKARQDPRPP